jgi:cell filamentation protein
MDGNGRATRAWLDAIARKSGRWLDYGVVSPAVWVQRASFSVPDLDEDRPQHHWVVPLIAVMSRRLDTHRDLPEQSRGREHDSGHDLGM